MKEIEIIVDGKIVAAAIDEYDIVQAPADLKGTALVDLTILDETGYWLKNPVEIIDSLYRRYDKLNVRDGDDKAIPFEKFANDSVADAVALMEEIKENEK